MTSQDDDDDDAGVFINAAVALIQRTISIRYIRLNV